MFIQCYKYTVLLRLNWVHPSSLLYIVLYVYYIYKYITYHIIWSIILYNISYNVIIRYIKLYIYNIICVFYYTHDTITLYNIVHHICTHGRLDEWNLATVNLSLSASQLTLSWRRLIFSKPPARRRMRSLNWMESISITRTRHIHQRAARHFFLYVIHSVFVCDNRKLSWSMARATMIIEVSLRSSFRYIPHNLTACVWIFVI